ncbi:MAG: hypothetical protein HIU83_17850 [Proteobacteria bacterium]|nr:hypothetical protein [Pseudomonadota bacterium]
MQKEEGNTVSKTFAGDEAKLETVTKRITIHNSTVLKMKKISSLFADEMPNDAKETEMISFFLDLSFDAFLRSGEIEKRIKDLTDGGN